MVWWRLYIRTYFSLPDEKSFLSSLSISTFGENDTFFTIACVLVVVDSFSLAERTSFSMMIVKLTEDGCDGDCDNDDADVDDYDCDYDYDKADGDGDTYFHNDGKSKNPFKDHSQSLKQWYNVVRIPAPTVFPVSRPGSDRKNPIFGAAPMT